MIIAVDIVMNFGLDIVHIVGKNFTNFVRNVDNVNGISSTLVPSADLLPPRAAASHCYLFRPTPAGVFYVGVSAAAPTPNKISWIRA